MDRGRQHRTLLTVLAAAGVCAVGALSLPRAAADPTPSVQATPVFSPPPVPPMSMQPRGRLKAAMDAHEPNGQAGVAERIARMSPEERAAFQRNLKVWQQLPPEERQDIRKQANARNREEILGALRDSGLQLNDDQKEIFALRYLQERRKLEREIEKQASAERARRLPLILQGLKHEFSGGGSPSPAAGAAQPPKTASTP